MANLPLIDISDAASQDRTRVLELADEIATACQDTGFFYVTGHGVSHDLISEVRNTIEKFFNLPVAEKLKYEITAKNYRGYIPMAAFTPSSGSDKADLYEGYKLHFECDPTHPVCRENNLYGPNKWPEYPNGFSNVLIRYWTELDRVSERLLSLFAIALGINETWFNDKFVNPLTNMTLLHYPSTVPLEDDIGFHPHKDTDAFTVLHPDPVGGLQVLRRDGSWIDAPAFDDAFIVNIGDMMELWSGGKFVSTPHRVINKTGKERYSFPYFAVPNHAITIEPLIDPVSGFNREPLNCGYISAEVWRMNRKDEIAGDTDLDLGSLIGRTPAA